MSRTTKDYVIGERWPIREAENRLKFRENIKYFRHEGKRNTWYVPDIPNAGDFIHVDTHNPKSRGYSGRVLKFQLVDGTFDEVAAPWHSNSEALMGDTGIDLTNKHLTFVVVSKERTHDERGRTVMKDVLYIDRDPEIGSFDRWKERAKPFIEEAVRNGESLFYYSESTSGSSCAPVVWKGELGIK